MTSAEMVSTAGARLSGLVAGRHVLVIQDTTSLRDDGDQCSLQLHPAIAVDATDGALPGLAHAAFLRRTGDKRGQRKNRPFVEKESRRWLDATCAAGKLMAGGAACVTVIADRESDIYEEFAGRPADVELLIRAGQDRVLEDGARLYACTDALPELGRETVSLPAAPGRRAREAVLAVRIRQVAIKRPQRRVPGETAKLPPRIALSLVEAREIDPPSDAAPAHWRLLTTHAVATLADARANHALRS